MMYYDEDSSEVRREDNRVPTRGVDVEEGTKGLGEDEV
jgi:hypothetical protein